MNIKILTHVYLFICIDYWYLTGGCCVPSLVDHSKTQRLNITILAYDFLSISPYFQLSLSSSHFLSPLFSVSSYSCVSLSNYTPIHNTHITHIHNTHIHITHIHITHD